MIDYCAVLFVKTGGLEMMVSQVWHDAFCFSSVILNWSI